MQDQIPDSTSVNLLAQINNDTTVHQALIEQIEGVTRRSLVCYFSNTEHPLGSMVIEDDKFLEMLLRTADFGRFDRKIDFMISSYGGHPEAAERMCRTLKTYGNHLRVIVPKHAMSAATLLTFGADGLLLGQTSELGPIDPQFQFRGPTGTSSIAVTDILAAYEDLLDKLDEATPNSQRVIGLAKLAEKLDPITISRAYHAMEHAEIAAFELLKVGLMKGKPDHEIEGARDKFILFGQERSHATCIRSHQLLEWGFGPLEVEPLTSPLWKHIWELYIRSENYMHRQGFTKYFLQRSGGLQLKAEQRQI